MGPEKAAQHPVDIKKPRLPASKPSNITSLLLIICPVVMVHPLLFLVALVTFVMVVGEVFSSAAGAVLIIRDFSGFGAVLGVVDLPSQTKVLAALIGSLAVPHLQGHGAVVALVCAQFLVIDGPPGPRSGHPSLEERHDNHFPSRLQQYKTQNTDSCCFNGDVKQTKQ